MMPESTLNVGFPVTLMGISAIFADEATESIYRLPTKRFLPPALAPEPLVREMDGTANPGCGGEAYDRKSVWIGRNKNPVYSE